MDSAHVSVPLRGPGGAGGGGKRMRKRRELDALAGGRNCRNGTAGAPSSRDQLLSESTDEYCSAVSGGKRGACEVVGLRPRGMRGSRRNVTSGGPRKALMRACVILLALGCSVATLTVAWLLVDVREQAAALRAELEQVAASGQGASEALQKCHATTRDLRQNQTRLGVRVLGLESAITNITHQALSAAEGLARVEQRLLDKPELLNVPRDLVGLENSVAQIGSQIRDLVTTTKTLKDQAATVDAATLALKNDVNMLKERVSAMENNTRQPNMSFQAVADRDDIINRIGKLSLNVTSINETLSNKLQWALDDQHKDHKILEGLQEMNQSMTARISTLEGSCSKTTAEQASLLGTINSLTDQITSVSDREKIIETRISELQAQTQLLYSNDTQLKASIAEMKQAFQHLNEGTLVSLTPPKAVSEVQNNVTSTPLSTASSVPAIVTNGKGLKPETTSVG